MTKAQPPSNPLLWCKATLLYAINPYDLTLWGSIRSPLFFLIYLLFLFPFYGVADVCIVLNWLFLEKSDKHQLVSFITRCKVMSVTAVTHSRLGLRVCRGAARCHDRRTTG